ncbi:olfactory receptor 5V1-like [Dendropsophus ebraccatus]|uniref:olfactory receptor 5V1-like n=1 Tax=Dendropsophus ebraccatus TaxID=150705 RepID=UPI0038312048
MDHGNVTTTTYFILTGISQKPLLHFIVFLLVLLIYLLTLRGNITIFLLVALDHHLHTPMYFFLANLSLLDVSCSTISLHRILISFISGDNTVSLVECFVQMFVFMSLICDELLLLAAMSYDRYVAICNPLRYQLVMDSKLCVLLAALCWVFDFLECLPSFIELFKLTCYDSNRMDHFFCDVVPFLKLSCSDTSFLQIYIFIVGVFITGFIPFVPIFISYSYIISTILSIRTSSGRRKAFYTCSSHLTVVLCLYASLGLQYLRPTSSTNLGSS